jgi:hypothetical protein
MILIILKIADAMIAETCLPHRPAEFQAERESSFDKLHGTFQRDLVCGREQRMEMIGHDHEFMKQIFPLITIMSEGFDQEIGGRCAPEDRLAVSGDRGDEEDAVVVYLEIVVKTGEFCLGEMSQFVATNSKTEHRA